MFGVIIEVQVDPGRTDEARAMVHDVVVSKAKELPGFQSGQWLWALEGDVINEVFTFASEDDARGFVARVRSEGPPPGAPITVRSVDAYELIAQA